MTIPVDPLRVVVWRETAVDTHQLLRWLHVCSFHRLFDWPHKALNS